MQPNETRQSPREDISDRILDLVDSGELEVGVKTSELDVAKLLGFTSRTPIVREALALLVRDGIIGQRPQVGVWVRPVSVSDAREVLALRTNVEKGVVADLVTEFPKDACRVAAASLMQVVDTMKYAFYQAKDKDVDRARQTSFVKLDASFRTQFATSAQRYSAAQAISRWSDKLRVFYGITPPSWTQMENTIANHEMLLKAVGNRNRDAGVAAIEASYQAAVAALPQT